MRLYKQVTDTKASTARHETCKNIYKAHGMTDLGQPDMMLDDRNIEKSNGNGYGWMDGFCLLLYTCTSVEMMCIQN